MSTRMILGVVIAFLLVADPLAAQQEGQALELPELTMEQRWERTAWSLDLLFCVSIADWKAQGKTAEDYGRHMVEVVGPGWQGVENPAQMMRAMYRNNMMWPGFEFELVSQSESAVTGRFSRAYKVHFGEDGELYGTTMEEYERAMKVFHTLIAESLGFEYEQKPDGERIIISITRST